MMEAVVWVLRLHPFQASLPGLEADALTAQGVEVEGEWSGDCRVR